MGKVLVIREKRPVDMSLPDGVYLGFWAGSIIELVFRGTTYELITDERGIGYKVVVTIKNSEATFDKIKN